MLRSLDLVDSPTHSHVHSRTHPHALTPSVRPSRPLPPFSLFLTRTQPPSHPSTHHPTHSIPSSLSPTHKLSPPTHLIH